MTVKTMLLSDAVVSINPNLPGRFLISHLVLNKGVSDSDGFFSTSPSRVLWEICGHFFLFLEDTNCNSCRRHCPCTIQHCYVVVAALSWKYCHTTFPCQPWDGDTKLTGRPRTSSTGCVSLLQWLHALLHTPRKMTASHRQMDGRMDEGGRREGRTHLKILSGACSPVTRS